MLMLLNLFLQSSQVRLLTRLLFGTRKSNHDYDSQNNIEDNTIE